MADDSERVYTIPLGKVLLSPDNRRAMRAINMIREFARRHMKAQEIKIDQSLSHEIWARGIRSPPRKVRVRMMRTDEGHVLVSPYSLSQGVIEEDNEKPAAEANVEDASAGGTGTEAGGSDDLPQGTDAKDDADGDRSSAASEGEPGAGKDVAGDADKGDGEPAQKPAEAPGQAADKDPEAGTPKPTDDKKQP